MNKRQRKKAKKKKIDNVFNKMLGLYLNGLTDTRKFLFSTWDEEHPPTDTIFTPRLNT